MPRGWSAPVVAVAAILASLVGAAPAAASSVRVPPDFFRVNFQLVDILDDATREAHMAEISALGVESIRINLSWRFVEARPPSGGVHTYAWDRYDGIVAAAARHGIRVDPTIVQSPSWNSANDLATEAFCRRAQSEAPLDVAPFADFAHAVAARYGAGGSFWQGHPELPPTPVTRYEVWNEENLNGGWCPAPDPAAYATMFAAAAERIRSLDPAATVGVGGVAEPVPGFSDGEQVGSYLGRMVAAQPQIRRGASAVAIHTYAEPTKGGLASRLRIFRAWRREGHFPRRTPMVVNELGWTTSGPTSQSEGGRVAGYRAIAKVMPRTNCNVSAVLPHTWMTREQDPGSGEDWFGIADPATAAPYPSALAYSRGIALQRGLLKRETPRKTIKACSGMPPPDRDADGVVDQRDYFALDPGRAARVRHGRLPPVECSVRLTGALGAGRAATGAARRRLHRLHRRLTRRCLPCPGSTRVAGAKLERRILARPARRVKLRSKPRGADQALSRAPLRS
jgi:hypothetical protein